MSRFERFAERTRPTRRSGMDLTDGVILLGAGLIVLGIALVYPPAAFIAGGLALVALVIVYSAKGGR